MESKAKAPKYIDEAGDNQKLKEELNRAIDREMEKPPEAIDHVRIDSMIRLLDQIDGHGEAEETMSKEEFAEKYLKGYVIPLSGSPHRRLRAAAAVAAIILIFGAGNFISVRATSRDIFTNVRDRVYMIYFDVLGNRTGESASYERTEEFQEIADIEEIGYESWEEVRTAAGEGFMVPYEIPKGMELQRIHLQQSGENDVGISAQYLDGKSSIRILIRLLNGDGKWLSATDKLEGPPDTKEINHLQVSFFHSDDGIHAMFQDEKYIYIVETNMEQEILEKVISEMR